MWCVNENLTACRRAMAMRLSTLELRARAMSCSSASSWACERREETQNWSGGSAKHEIIVKLDQCGGLLQNTWLLTDFNRHLSFLLQYVSHFR